MSYSKASWNKRKLEPGKDLCSGKAKDKLEELLSQILQRLNELFVTEGLSDAHMRQLCLHDLGQSAREQCRDGSDQQQHRRAGALGDFSKAVHDADTDSGVAHQNQMMQYLSSAHVASGFARVIFDLLLAGKGARDRAS